MNTATKLMQLAVLVGGMAWLPMCSSDSDDNGTPAPSPAAPSGGSATAGGAPAAGQPATGTGGSPAATTATINIQNFAYSPGNVTVAPGATVTVMNMDSVAHTATSQSATGNFTRGAVNGVQFDTGTINPGASGSFTIPASAPSGTVVPYYCAIHLQGMGQGTVTIQ
jgi:plastocyanin